MNENLDKYDGLARNIQPPKGKLGVLLPGMGAVSSTLIAGVQLVNAGYSQPIGSVTQMSRIRLGKRDNPQYPYIKDFVPLSPLKDLVFGGWDIYDDNCYQAALACGVIDKNELEPIRKQLEEIKPWPAVFDPAFVKNLSGPNVKKASNKMELAEMLMQDMEKFKKQHGIDRLVMCWCGSTEVYQEDMNHEAFNTIDGFEKALKNNLAIIPP